MCYILSRIVIVVLLTTGNIALANEVKSDADAKPDVKQSLTKKSPQKTVTIESRVTGSQEQPKVLYIMPWQGITHPVTIKGKETQLVLPMFRPINPKTFKKEVREFAATQAQTKTNN
jgi:hypothetical protein